MKTADDLIQRLVSHGGAIVSSGDCSEMEIADARVRGDFYVDDNGLGYVIRLKKWLDRVHAADGYMQSSDINATEGTAMTPDQFVTMIANMTREGEGGFESDATDSMMALDNLIEKAREIQQPASAIPDQNQTGD